MRCLTVGCALVLGISQVSAQEQLPQERAEQAAKLLAAQAAKLKDVQLKTDVDTQKPYGLKKGELALLVIPDKNLSKERLNKAGKDVMVVGQLWLRGITPVAAGRATPADKLRLVKVTSKGE